MKAVLFLISICVAFNVYSNEDCSLESLKLNNDSNIAVKLFYTGTCHYRNKEYHLAASSWQKLNAMNRVDERYKILQVETLNNLGFLMFFGLGIEKNQIEAVEYWKKAVALGETESEYHLCHAYADKKQPTFNRQMAQIHCRKALMAYRGMEATDEEILSDIEKYYEQVK